MELVVGMEKRLEQQSSKVADLEDYIDSLLMRSGYPQCGPISCVIFLYDTRGVGHS